MDNAGGADDMYGHPAAFFPSYGSQCMGPGYGKWYASNGTDGIQPMPEMAKVFALYRKGMTLGDKARVETGKEIWRIVLDEVWGIGTVGDRADRQAQLINQLPHRPVGWRVKVGERVV